MPFLLQKFLSLLVRILHPSIPKHLRHYVRNNYYARLRQWKYFIPDYIIRKPYKIIEFNGEFSQEIMWVLPFAYWHCKNGTLKKTISPKGMEPFYFFSPDHEEPYSVREWKRVEYYFETPNVAHTRSISFNKFLPVPLKEHYKNTLLTYNKPLLIIANKYNVEWDGPPINFFNFEQLAAIFSRFQDKYQIIYNRPPAKEIVGDNSEIKDLQEHAWIKENFPSVLLLEDLYQGNKNHVKNFNHLQLMAYANCDHFISVHGGASVLASYFGGINLIYSKQGIEHGLGEFENNYHYFSGAKIEVARTEEELHNKLNIIPI